MKSKAGFTLLELLIAITVSMIIMAGVYSVFLSQQKSTTAQINVSDIQQNLRAAMDFLARDIRMAGYPGTDRGNTAGFGFDDVRFRDLSGSQDPAGNGFLQFSWDMDEDGTKDGGETVGYSLSDSSGIAPIALMRDTGGGAQPMAGYIIALGLAFAFDSDDGDLQLDEDAAGNVIWAVDTDNDGDWDNLDTNGDGEISAADLSGGATTGRIAGTDTGIAVRYGDIRAVRIWLLGRSQAPDNAYTDTNVYVVGRDVIQPNNNFRHRILERIVLCRNMGLE
jgi:type IV pilus assembly protein PilW